MTPTAIRTISTVAMISPQGVCRWLTIFLDWARLAAVRAWPLLEVALPAAVRRAPVLPVAPYSAAVLPVVALPGWFFFGPPDVGFVGLVIGSLSSRCERSARCRTSGSSLGAQSVYWLGSRASCAQRGAQDAGESRRCPALGLAW
jgi:hypothetical protein